jgi:hypothetical protein
MARRPSWSVRHYVGEGRSFDDVLEMASLLRPPKEALQILDVLDSILKAGWR